MGGPGSGSGWRAFSKRATSDLNAIDVRRWARGGFLRPGSSFTTSWSWGGERVASIRVRAEFGRVILNYRHREAGGEWTDAEYPVRLDYTPCHLGGERVWFRCPARGCGRRVARLFGGAVFACRNCQQLAYPSQREGHADRAARKAERLREKLGWEPGILNGEGLKPKGMHWRTFERLSAEHEELVNQSMVAMMMMRFRRFL